MVVKRIEISRETIEPWVAVAQSSRLLEDILSQIKEPRQGSNFEKVNALYPYERSSDWCREFLSAGIEHMLLWASHVAPLSFNPGAEVTHTFRPVQTLSRAAVESAAHAVWIMDQSTAQGCVQRHLSVVLDDLEQQRKAAQESERKTYLVEAKSLLLKRAEASSGEMKIDRFPGYMGLVKQAASTVAAKGKVDTNMADPAVVERLWRASAGSAHGKRWPALELQVVEPGREIAPGTFETSRIPNPEAITKILNLANAVLTYGVFRFVDYSGYEPDLAPIMAAAQERLSKKIPRRTDVPSSAPN